AGRRAAQGRQGIAAPFSLPSNGVFLPARRAGGQGSGEKRSVRTSDDAETPGSRLRAYLPLKAKSALGFEKVKKNFSKTY
ncbi:MAG: hypothetical protein MJ192_03220, partial [Clostridia bacterium]|nr:hypothetical protein [Clostridia bacterium]